MLAGGSIAGVLGQNATVAATAAANEAENNANEHWAFLICLLCNLYPGPESINGVQNPVSGLTSPEDI